GCCLLGCSTMYEENCRLALVLLKTIGNIRIHQKDRIIRGAVLQVLLNLHSIHTGHTVHNRRHYDFTQRFLRLLGHKSVRWAGTRTRLALNSLQPTRRGIRRKTSPRRPVPESLDSSTRSRNTHPARVLRRRVPTRSVLRANATVRR